MRVSFFGVTHAGLNDCRSGNAGARARIFRLGGIGIQVGSAVGAVLFFLLTVTWDVFNNAYRL